MVVDWKQKYLELAVQVEILQETIQTEFYNLKFKTDNILKTIEDVKRADRKERQVARYCRLKEDYKTSVEYSDRCGRTITYPAGTLIEGTIRGGTVHVYLDEEGDGNLYFPANIVEEIEIPWADIDETKVIRQG